MGLRFEKLRTVVERVWRWNPWLRTTCQCFFYALWGFPLIFVILVLLKSSLLGVHDAGLPYDGPVVVVRTVKSLCFCRSLNCYVFLSCKPL
ncbi:hypothetical protein NC651_006364 [Populus alba x Populus x berolinensis]|nr:hypothetical protein NC651_006364 [Populus alba x Populus x berolinensis]